MTVGLATFWQVFFALLIWVPLVFLWGFTFVDLVRRDDLSGLATFGWLMAILLVPFVGAFIYIIVRPRPEPTGHIYRTGPGVAEELERLKVLYEQGELTEEEYRRQKARVLA